MDINLRQPIFIHGQLYVALSRATDVEKLLILTTEETTRRIKNIIFEEALLRPPQEDRSSI